MDLYNKSKPILEHLALKHCMDFVLAYSST